MEDLHDIDCVILAVAHDAFKKMSLADFNAFYRQCRQDEKNVLIDVKGIYNVNDLKKSGLMWWRL